MPKMRVLDLHGTHYEMGFQHGSVYKDSIRQIAKERIHLSQDSAWAGRKLSLERVLGLAEDCLEAHYRYAPELMKELEGIGAAAGLSLAELIIANGFTDFVDVVYNAEKSATATPIYGNECTAFMVSGEAAADGRSLFGQTWDMHATATPYVILLRGRPDDGPAFLGFTITGCVGMVGMNDKGITVGINNLMGADGRPGVTWPFVIRKVLLQDNLEDALDCILSADLAGAHNYLLMDGHGKGCNVEAMSSAHHVEWLNGRAYVHANKCLNPLTQTLERELTADLHEDSDIRRRRAHDFLDQRELTPESLMTLTRDRNGERFSICSHAEAPFFSETCCAAVMRPATRELWGVWGLPTENDYEHFTL